MLLSSELQSPLLLGNEASKGFIKTFAADDVAAIPVSGAPGEFELHFTALITLF